MCKKLQNIETGKDEIDYALQHKALVRYRWAGDHCTFEGPRGRMTAANSRYEFPPWLRRKIMAGLIAIGLGCVLLAVIVGTGAL